MKYLIIGIISFFTFLQQLIAQFKIGKVDFFVDITESKWNKIVQKSKDENKLILIYNKQPFKLEEKSNSQKHHRDSLIARLNDDSIVDFFAKNLIPVILSPLYVSSTKEEFVQQLFYKYSIARNDCFQFYNSEIKLLHKCFNNAVIKNIFLNDFKNALDSNCQNYFLKSKYKSVLKDSVLILNLLESLIGQEMENEGILIDYLKEQNNIFTPNNFKIIVASGVSETSEKLISNNKESWKKIIDSNSINSFLQRIAYWRLSFYYLQNMPNVSIDSLIVMGINDYGNIGKHQAIRFLFETYLQIKNSNNSITYLLHNYFLTIDFTQFSTQFNNNLAWYIFNNQIERSILELGLKLASDNLEKKKDDEYYDTKACLLYKLGFKNEAMEIEKLAIEICKDESNLKEYHYRLKRMMKNKSTWEN